MDSLFDGVSGRWWRLRRRGLVEGSRSLWVGPILSFTPFCHDAFPPHKPRNNGASQPRTITSEIMSQNKSFFLEIVFYQVFVTTMKT
jgi:hypothetical protein